MPEPRLAQALARVDAAIARLEGVALAVPASSDAALAERHRRLQAAAAAALARLDRLIGTEG